MAVDGMDGCSARRDEFEVNVRSNFDDLKQAYSRDARQADVTAPAAPPNSDGRPRQNASDHFHRNHVDDSTAPSAACVVLPLLHVSAASPSRAPVQISPEQYSMRVGSHLWSELRYHIV